jgi:hypothetical protein
MCILMYIMRIYLSSLQQRMARGPNHAHQGLSSKGPSSESWEAMFNPTQQLPATQKTPICQPFFAPTERSTCRHCS